LLTSHSQNKPSTELRLYLKNQIGLTDSAIKLGVRKSEQENAPLPIILLTYGLISMSDFQKLLDWLNSYS